MNELTLKTVISQIHFIRGKKIMLDIDLAALYEVETRALNQAVMRNIDRFPEDFLFRLTEKEYNDLRSQFVISSWGGRRTLPYAFTEQGVAMLSGLLKSKRAIQVNIAIMRAFVKMRELINENKEMVKKIEQLEEKYDVQFKLVFDAIKFIIKGQEEPRKPVGFKLPKKSDDQ